MSNGTDLFALFERAAAMPPSERDAFLAGSGASEETLARVNAMLRADAGAVALDHTHGGLALLAALHDETASQPTDLPTLRGHYRIIRLIGEGGSGTVYEAEQASPKRRVAIKAIRAGLASRRAVARLRAEADILAKLHHPGIAQVIEAGLGEENQPDQAFIVMELVDGPPIHRHAEERSLGRRARIELFLQVCDAVEHAHQRGVIHRDLKPANILVDRQGNAKVLDFGIARLLSPDAQGIQNAEHAHTTEHGMVVGTLGYMSPEQASARPNAIDVRTDVYALGAILYELLAGVPALPVGSASITEALRIIETQVPRPLSFHDRSMRGDLTVIVARALEKEPARRFQSVTEFADDLRRSIDGRPIRSRPQSASYVLTRLARRHWAITAMGGLILALLLVFAARSTIDAARFRAMASREARARAIETEARTLAERERVRADQINTLLEAELAAVEIERARLEARIGNGFAAEAILWPAYFRDPDSPAVRGALWELFESHPCSWSVIVPAAASGAASPDMDWIAIGTRNGAVALLDPGDGSMLAEIAADDDASPIVALLPESAHRLWCVQQSGRLRLLTIGGEVMATIARTHTIPTNPTAAAIHPGAGLIAFAFADAGVSVHAIQDGSTLAAWRAGERGLRCIAIAPDGDRIAVAGTDRVIRIYAYPSGHPLDELRGHERDVTAIAFDPIGRGRIIRTMSPDQSLRRWNIDDATSTIEATLQDFPQSIVHRADGALLLTESDRVWLQPSPGESLRSVAYPRTRLAHAFAASDSVFTIDFSGEVRRWETVQGLSTNITKPHEQWIFGIEIVAAQNLMVTSSGDSTIRFADATGIHERARFDLPPRVRARVVRASPDGTIIAAGCSDGFVRTFDAQSLTLVETIPGPGGEIYSLAFNPDGTVMAGGATSRSIRFWSTTDHKVLGDMTGLESIPRGMRFSPDGQTLYSSGALRGILVIDTNERSVRRTLPTPDEPWSIALSPDGRMLAAGLFDATVVCIDLPDGTTRIGTTRHRLVIAGLDFSPDGRTIATGGDDGAIRLWDTADAGLRAVRVLDASTGPVPMVRLDPSGTIVYAGTSAGKLITWSLNTHDERIARNRDAARTRHSSTDQR